MAITEDEHKELLDQFEELDQKLLLAEGLKETAEAELECCESDLAELKATAKTLEQVASLALDALLKIMEAIRKS